MITVIDDEEQIAMIGSPNRVDLWATFIRRHDLRAVAELGVAQGAFAEQMLTRCPDIERYYLIDPWKHLLDWNKPANQGDDTFEDFYKESLARTEPWKEARVVLRGRTAEVIHSIPDDSLDLAYVDADHTLRGITIDLIRVWPKVRTGGFIGGDDFCPSIWQHPQDFEPTLVHPYAIYFAEAMDVPIVALPHNQFLIEKSRTGFHLLDLTGAYGDHTLRRALLVPNDRSITRLARRIVGRLKPKTAP